MATWILILFAHMGGYSPGQGNALTSVAGFQSRDACQTAGKTAMAITSDTRKMIEFVCVKDR